MVWLTIIGSASIQIRADDKYFEPDVRRAVGKLKNVEIQLRVDADIAKASKKIRDLRYRITSKDAVLKVDADVTKAEDKLSKLLAKFINKDLMFNVVANTQGANTQLTDLQNRFTSTRVPFTAQANTRAANAALAFTARRRNAEIDAKISPQTMAALTGVFNTLTGTLPIDKIRSSLQGLAANFEGAALKAAVLTAALGALGGAALTGAANLFSIVSDLGQLGGLVALMPAGLFALQTILKTNKMAWEGFGDAAKDNSAKANQALAKLPPEAQKAAVALRGVREEIQKPVQAAFWKEVGTSLQDMVEAQLPSVIDGLSGIGRAWGGFNKEIFDTIANMGDFNDVFLTVERMVDNLAPAIKPAITALGQFVGIGSNFLPRFGTYMSELATRFGAWADAAYKSGEMMGWMNNAIQRAQELGSIVKSTAVIFEGLANAARMSGAAGLTDLANGMKNIATIVNGEPFQSRLITVLEGARSGTEAFSRGIQNLTDYIGESARGISIFLDEAGKIAGVAMDSIRSLFDGTGLGNGIYMALSGLRTAMIDLQPGFAQLGAALGSLGRIAGELFVNMGPGLNQLFETLNGVIGNLEDGIISAMPVFNEFIQSILAVVQGPIIELAGILGDILEGFSNLPSGIQTAIMAVGLFLLLKGKFVGFFQPLLTSAVTSTAGIRAAMAGATGATATAVAGMKASFSSLLAGLGGPIGIALLAITGAFADFARTQQNTKTQVDNLAGAFESTGGKINGVVIGVIGDNLKLKDSFLGVFEAASTADIANDVGIPLEQVAKAAAGVPGAMDKVQDSLRRSGDSATVLGSGISVVVESLLKVGGAAAGVAKIAEFFGIGQSKGDQLNKSIAEQARLVQDGLKQYQGMADALDVSTAAAARLTQNYATLADATADASSRSAALKDNINILSDSMNSVRDAERDHATQMFDLGDAMAKLGEAQGKVLDANGRMDNSFRNSLLTKGGMFSTASREAIEFSQQMDDAASSIIDSGIAEMQRLEATGSSTAAAQAGALAKMNEQTAALRDKLITLGFDAKTADGILKQLGLDPTKLTGAMVLDTADAEGAAQRLALMLGAIQNGNWEVALAASTQDVQDSILKVDAYKKAYEEGGWEAVVGIIDETGPGIADLMVRLSEAKSQAEIDAIIRAEFTGKPAFQEANAEVDYFGNRTSEAKLGADAAGVEAGVATGKAQISGFNMVEGKGKVTAEDLTGPGLDSARINMGTLPDVLRHFLAQDGTSPGKTAAQITMNGLTNVTRFLFGNNQTAGGKTAAQATMDTLMSVTRPLFGSNQAAPGRTAAQATLNTLAAVTRSLFGSNQAGTGRNAAQATLNSLANVTRSLFASNQAGGGKNAAQAVINALTGKTVGLEARDNASGIVSRVAGMVIGDKTFNITGVLGGVSAVVRMALGMADGGIMKGGVQTFANGGILNKAVAPAIKSYAGGGVENHVAQIAKGAWPVRVWAEPETGGEAYLPLHPSKRKRSLEILRQVMKEFGLGQFVQFDQGGFMPKTSYSSISSVGSPQARAFSGTTSTSSAPSVAPIVVNVYPSAGMDEVAVGKAAMRELNWMIQSR